MPRRKEWPFSPIHYGREGDNEYSSLGIPLATSAAETEYEALMRCAPHQDPQLSKAELAPLRDAIADAIDALPERSRWIFNACVVERRPLRAVAADLALSKSYVHRLLEAARATLAVRLSEHPDVQEYLNR